MRKRPLFSFEDDEQQEEHEPGPKGHEGRKPPVTREEDWTAVKVVLVDVDIPMARLAVLVLKLLVVLAPFALVLLAVLYFAGVIAIPG